jgi:hypothetical protein
MCFLTSFPSYVVSYFFPLICGFLLLSPHMWFLTSFPSYVVPYLLSLTTGLETDTMDRMDDTLLDMLSTNVDESEFSCTSICHHLFERDNVSLFIASNPCKHDILSQESHTGTNTHRYVSDSTDYMHPNMKVTLLLSLTHTHTHTHTYDSHSTHWAWHRGRGRSRH